MTHIPVHVRWGFGNFPDKTFNYKLKVFLYQVNSFLWQIQWSDSFEALWEVCWLQSWWTKLFGQSCPKNLFDKSKLHQETSVAHGTKQLTGTQL